MDRLFSLELDGLRAHIFLVEPVRLPGLGNWYDYLSEEL
jgi:hypothetical protein